MKSLRESLLDNDMDLKDLAVELPEITNSVLKKALDGEFWLDAIPTWAWINYMDNAIKEAPEPTAYCEGALRSIIAAMDKVKHGLGSLNETGIQGLRNTKRFWEELDEILNKTPVITSIFLPDLISSNYIIILFDSKADATTRYKLLTALTKSKWVDAAGFGDNPTSVKTPTSPNDPTLTQSGYAAIALSGKFKREFNKV